VERQPKCVTSRRVSPAQATRYTSRNLPGTAAVKKTSEVQVGQIGTRPWRTSTALCEKSVTGSSRATCRWGAILALHHAAQHPQDVSALALYAPSLWLDGWGIPWYASFFALIRQKWLADYIPFAERHPWGIKDPRLRALVEQAITSGDSSQAGIAALPGSLMLELRWLIRKVQREIGHVRQPALIVHPRNDDRASLRNLDYLQNNLGGLTHTLVLDDSYHVVTLDRQRQLVLDRTLAFLSLLEQKKTITIDEDDVSEWLC